MQGRFQAALPAIEAPPWIRAIRGAIPLAALALVLGAIPAAAGECPGTFAPAVLPAEVPPLAEGACPTSANIGTGPKIVQQDYAVAGLTLEEFLAAYREALATRGWGRIKESEVGLVRSLSAAHPAGLAVTLVVNDLVRPGADRTPQAPGVNLKLILRRAR